MDACSHDDDLSINRHITCGCPTNQSPHFVQDIILWPKLWDMVRDWGIEDMRSLTAIIKVLSTLTLKDYQCPFCGFQLSRDLHLSSQSLSDFVFLLILYRCPVGSELRHLSKYGST